MEKRLSSMLVMVIFALTLNAQIGLLGSKEETIKRVEIAKRGTVQVLVDGIKTGTGFFVSEGGDVVTNFHVVVTPNTKLVDEKSGIAVISDIRVVTFNNDTFQVELKSKLNNKDNLIKSYIWDYAILRQKKKQRVETYFKLGGESDMVEGSTVYTCGYPLSLHKPFVSTGLLSTKFKETRFYGNYSFPIDALLLDMTINKGNSGGPLIALGDKPENDKVVGITSFIVTPYYDEIEGLNKYIDNMSGRGGIAIMGVDFLEYASLINSAVNANSVGISGAISISAVKKDLNE